MGGQTNVPYNSQLDAYALYHLIQESPEAATSVSAGPALPALGHALSGAVATAGTKVLLYPLELVTTRLQVQRQLHGPRETPSAARDADAEYSSLVDAIRKIYKHEGGLRAFYTGCAPDVGKGIADSFLFFLAYSFLRQRQLKNDGTRALSVFKELSVGVAAGAFAKLITTPLQNIVTRQQTAALVSARDPTSTATPQDSDKLSMKDIALQIRSERGIAGFWAGYSASIILTLNPAITFAVDNMLKRLLPKSTRERTPAQLTFLIAALSKVIATTMTYPVMLAKSRAQAASSTSITAEEGTQKDDKPFPTKQSDMKQRAHQALRLLSAQYAIFLSLRKIYGSEGLSGLYSGLESEVLKGFLSHGLTMTIKDTMHVGVIQLYYVMLRLTQGWPTQLQKAQEGAQAVAANATENAGIVGGRVSEGAKQLVDDGKKAIVGEK